MSRRRARLLALATTIAFAPTLAHACDYPRLVFTPEKSGDFSRYRATWRDATFSIANASGKPADAFSDPPLSVAANGKTCDIDGGNWPADAIFVSKDGKLLIAYEFSGSDAALVAWDIATCAKKASVDVSGKKFPTFPEGYPISAREKARAEAKPFRVKLAGKSISLDKRCLAK